MSTIGESRSEEIAIGADTIVSGESAANALGYDATPEYENREMLERRRLDKLLEVYRVSTEDED
jgi:hypothetical protein